MQRAQAQLGLNAAERREGQARRRLSFLVLIMGCLALALTIVSDFRASALPTGSPDDTLTTGSASFEAQEARGEFSRFSHTDERHARLPCLLCHRREDNSPRPKMPGRSGHMPCAGCHVQQFADQNSLICTICHTDAKTEAVKPFPSLRSFNMRFDHARHTTDGARSGAACAICHKPERAGVALSIPSGQSAHNTCFRCHAPRTQSSAGRDISSCDTCHQIGRLMRTPVWREAYKVSFSHARHGPRQGVSCADCHSIRAGVAQSMQVSAPAPLMHHRAARAQSCLSCHNDKRAFGIANFSNCKKCHQAAHFYF